MLMGVETQKSSSFILVWRQQYEQAHTQFYRRILMDDIKSTFVFFPHERCLHVLFMHTTG